MTKHIGPKILLVGCGKMGSALLNGWLNQNLKASDISLIEPKKANVDEFIKSGVNTFRQIDDVKLQYKPDFVIFAVKPQMMDKIIPAYKCFSGNTAFVSIAAGKTINYFEKILGNQNPIIRAMPNTPAAVGRGITVACGNNSVSKKIRVTSLALLAAVGEACWIDDENQIDIVTAISGSGPAYVFLLAESLLLAGTEAGLDHELAKNLAIKTVSGSGELLLRSSEEIAKLRENVTSPGGTTEAALSTLMGQDGLKTLIGKAVKKASQRSRDLNK